MNRGSKNRGFRRTSNPAFRWLLAAGFGVGIAGTGMARAESTQDSITVSTAAVGQSKGLSSRGLIRNVGDGAFRRTLFTTGVERDGELIQTPEALDLRPVPQQLSRLSFGTVGQLSSGSTPRSRQGDAEVSLNEAVSGENSGVLSWLPTPAQQSAIVSQQIQSFVEAKNSQEIQLLPSFSDLRLALAAASVSGAGNPFQVIVGSHNLQPEMAGQPVTLQVSNTSSSPLHVAGLNFYMQVADGGPGFGSIFGPAIEAGDLTTGTLFAGNNNGTVISPDNTLHLAYWGVTTADGTVTLAANETRNIGTFIFDTRGVSAGSYDLELVWTWTDPDPTPTTFVAPGGAEPGIEIHSGQLVVVPEPWAVSLISSLALGGFVWVRRSRQNAARA